MNLYIIQLIAEKISPALARTINLAIYALLISIVWAISIYIESWEIIDYRTFIIPFILSILWWIDKYLRDYFQKIKDE